MKKIIMTECELKKITRKELDQFALAFKDGEMIDVQLAVGIYHEYTKNNGHSSKDDHCLLEIIDWYIEKSHVKDFVLLRVFDNDICHVEIKKDN